MKEENPCYTLKRKIDQIGKKEIHQKDIKKRCLLRWGFSDS